jgi:hypothetical protein
VGTKFLNHMWLGFYAYGFNMYLWDRYYAISQQFLIVQLVGVRGGRLLMNNIVKNIFDNMTAHVKNFGYWLTLQDLEALGTQ